MSLRTVAEDTPISYFLRSDFDQVIPPNSIYSSTMILRMVILRASIFFIIVGYSSQETKSILGSFRICVFIFFTDSSSEKFPLNKYIFVSQRSSDSALTIDSIR